MVATMIAVPSIVVAQPPAAALRLTLDEAIRRGLETSHRIAEASARGEAAEAVAGLRRAATLPQVAAQGGYMRTNHVDEFGVLLPTNQLRIIYPDVPDNYRARLDLQWPIYTGGRLDALERAARIEATASADEVAAARSDLTFEIARAYWALVAAIESERVVEQAVGRATAHVTDVRNQLTAGLVPPNELYTVQAQESRQRMLAVQAQATRDVAEAELGRFVGGSPGVPIEPADAADPPPASTTPLPELIEPARSVRKHQAGRRGRWRHRLRPAEPAHLPPRRQMAPIVGRRRQRQLAAVRRRTRAQRTGRGHRPGTRAGGASRRFRRIAGGRSTAASTRSTGEPRRHRGGHRRCPQRGRSAPCSRRSFRRRRGDGHRCPRRAGRAAPGRARSHAGDGQCAAGRCEARADPRPMNAISVVDLTKRFGEFVAVDHLAFEVAQGEVFGFLGSNGAGKSTTIRMLCGLLKPTSGTATVGGVDVGRDPEGVKRRIGYMSQRFSLYERLTVDQNIRFFGGIYGLDRARLAERRRFVLEMAGLTGREQTLAADLAGGWRQRLALGCAILHEPPIVFLDEPTGGVDPLSRREFWSLIDRLSGAGVTVLVTTHYLDEAEHCNRIAIIHGGRLAAIGTTGELKRVFAGRAILEVRAANPIETMRVLDTMPEIETTRVFGTSVHAVLKGAAPAAMPRIRQHLDAAGLAVESIAEVEPSLEDVFLEVVEHKSAA
jgi:ABC-2 type transport system ATP-binding protein